MLGAFAFLFISIRELRQAFYDFEKLQVHTGVIQSKAVIDTIEDDKKRTIIYLKLIDDNNEYLSSKYAEHLNENLNIGDSVKLYTNTSSSFFGNFVSNESATEIWTTNNPNEVYHIVRISDNSILLDFSSHKKSLKKMLWIFPLASICFFGWFIYRRSGRKSSLVIEA
ncbi:MAG: hypothetical protein HYR66_00110 [Sphingobacteriales bacterium]|nr:hypothetical protein [Sphingobacteriales bacterium]